MNLSHAANRSAARRSLLGKCFVLFAFSAVVGQSGLHTSAKPAAGAAAKAVKVSLTVCVSDETGRRVALQPLLLNSRSNASDVIKGPNSDGCYASPPIKLAPGQVYFVAATADGRTAFKQFTVDDTQKPINLSLAKQGGAGSADIEVCAKDERGNALTIADVGLAGVQGQLTKKTPSDPSCYRVASAASGEYRLALIAQGSQSQAAPPFSPTELRLVGSSLVLLSLLGLALGALHYFRFHRFAPLVARQATVEVIDRNVRGLSSKVSLPQTPSVSQSDDVPHSPTSADGDDAPDRDKPDGRVSNVTPESSAAHPTKSAAGTRASTRTSARWQNSDFEEAKAKYIELSSGGQSVEHFYLMPSGATTASGTVEDVRIELFEQSKGTYVGFRSAANESEAFVFPMPNRHFSTDTFKALFPSLSAPDYESGNIEPRVAVNTAPKVWKVL